MGMKTPTDGPPNVSKKIQKVTTYVLYMHQATYQKWGLNIQNWENVIERSLGTMVKTTEPEYSQKCDTAGFFFSGDRLVEANTHSESGPEIRTNKKNPEKSRKNYRPAGFS